MNDSVRGAGWFPECEGERWGERWGIGPEAGLPFMQLRAWRNWKTRGI